MTNLTFFFDRQIGTRLPKVLSQMKPPMRIEWHQNWGYAANMPDDQWLADVGKRNWIVVSQDLKWHKIGIEAEAIKQHNIRCFYLPCASEGRWVSLCNIVKYHKKLIEIASSKPAPFIFRLRKNGQFYKVSL